MAEFVEFLADLHPEVERALDRLLPAESEEPARLHAAMRYSLFAGGKRVRPGLVVLGGEIYGAPRSTLLDGAAAMEMIHTFSLIHDDLPALDNDDLRRGRPTLHKQFDEAMAILAGEIYGAPRSTLLDGAAAMEMIHTFSLIHDDLPALDNDDLRRGRPTLHKQFDEALAILAGDALLDHALLCLARGPSEVPAAARARAVVVAAEAVGSSGMIGGQVWDIEAERQWPDDPAAALERIHRHKTGCLLVASLLLGGIYAGVGEAEEKLLRGLGEALGLLFQIGDDLLDVEGSTEVLGKTAGKDAAARKLTYPGLFGVDESRRRFDAVAAEALDLVDLVPRHGDTLRSLVRYLGERDR